MCLMQGCFHNYFCMFSHAKIIKGRSKHTGERVVLKVTHVKDPEGRGVGGGMSVPTKYIKINM